MEITYEDLRKWFGRKGAKGKTGGWVDCNSPDGKGGYKPCGRKKGEKRKYPACRPTPAGCKDKGKGKKWGKKSGKSKKMRKEDLISIVREELNNLMHSSSPSQITEKDDACTRKVKARYKVWPSAYASGAVSKCRKVGAANWGNKSKKKKKKKNESLIQEIKEYYVDNINEIQMIEDALNEEYCSECASTMEEGRKKKKCKPAKGKRFAKRVNGKCRSFGQKGKASDGGDRIRPGTKKAHAYCARSAKIKKCKNPPCANTLSRRKWKCQGSRSVVEGFNKIATELYIIK